MKKPQKKLEDTIRELRQRYKNVPSPLSNIKSNLSEDIHFIPQNPTPQNFKTKLLGDFKPQQQKFY
jgi:hypothetical protein